MTTAYFARPTSHYGTPEDEFLARNLKAMGFELLDPSRPECQVAYENLKASGDKDPMRYFRDMTRSADVLIFVPFRNGAIGAGVANQIEAVLEAGRPVMEARMSFSVGEFDRQDLFTRTLSVEETRALVRGQVRQEFYSDVQELGPEVFEDRVNPGDWRVEAFVEDGTSQVAIFSGHDAERRARAFHRAYYLTEPVR